MVGGRGVDGGYATITTIMITEAGTARHEVLRSTELGGCRTAREKPPKELLSPDNSMFALHPCTEARRLVLTLPVLAAVNPNSDLMRLHVHEEL